MTEGLAHLSRMDICEQGPDVERAFSSDELSLGANQGTHADKVVRSLPNIDDAYQPRVQPPSTDKVVIAVEVCLKPRTTVRHDEIRQAVERMLDKRSLTYEEGPILFCQTDEPFLYEHVESITLSDEDGRASANGVLLFWQVTLQVHVYQLHEEGPSEELEGNDSIASFHEWTLPGREFHGLWESLIYDSSLKQHLLRYALSALLFSDRGVNSHLVAWNRVVLLHGPPGTGKTSLCKALAQKLSIQFSYRFPQAQLVEVTKLFQKIEDIVEDGTTLVFVLIDEAESLTAARQAALSGSEPSDSIRVVNALLTQLDRLKRWPNVVVLTTSNISAAIDLAFVDRADIKAYVGPPSLEARYEILRSCLKELQRVGIINQQKVEPYDSELLTFKILSLRMKERTEEARVLLSVDISRNLLAVAEACEGFSGRALRKLPFLAHASMGPLTDCDYSVFLAAMHEAIKRELSDRALM